MMTSSYLKQYFNRCQSIIPKPWFPTLFTSWKLLIDNQTKKQHSRIPQINQIKTYITVDINHFDEKLNEMISLQNRAIDANSEIDRLLNVLKKVHLNIENNPYTELLHQKKSDIEKLQCDINEVILMLFNLLYEVKVFWGVETVTLELDEFDEFNQIRKNPASLLIDKFMQVNKLLAKIETDKKILPTEDIKKSKTKKKPCQRQRALTL